MGNPSVFCAVSYTNRLYSNRTVFKQIIVDKILIKQIGEARTALVKQDSRKGKCGGLSQFDRYRSTAN